LSFKRQGSNKHGKPLCLVLAKVTWQDKGYRSSWAKLEPMLNVGMIRSAVLAMASLAALTTWISAVLGVFAVNALIRVQLGRKTPSRSSNVIQGKAPYHPRLMAFPPNDKAA